LIAARGLNDPGSLSNTEIKAVCGSVLTQTKDHKITPLSEILKKRPI
jgi:hypothetical protein